VWHTAPVEDQRDITNGEGSTWIRPTLRRLSASSNARTGYVVFPVETQVPGGPSGTFFPAGPAPS